MENVWVLAALWVGLALIATLLAIWFKISTALTEIVVGTVAQFIIVAFYWPRWACGEDGLDYFLGGNRRRCPHLPCRRRTRSRSLPNQMERSDGGWARGLFWAFSGLRGHRALRAPLGDAPQLAGRSGALSTTSVAVVYAVMLELGFNKTDFGKAILGACFVNDLGTVIALGLIFSPFTMRTLIFVVVSVLVFAVCRS